MSQIVRSNLLADVFRILFKQLIDGCTVQTFIAIAKKKVLTLNPFFLSVPSTTTGERLLLYHS